MVDLIKFNHTSIKANYISENCTDTYLESQIAEEHNHIGTIDDKDSK
jgi:hypothetical protein